MHLNIDEFTPSWLKISSKKKGKKTLKKKNREMTSSIPANWVKSVSDVEKEREEKESERERKWEEEEEEE